MLPSAGHPWINLSLRLLILCGMVLPSTACSAIPLMEDSESTPDPVFGVEEVTSIALPPTWTATHTLPPTNTPPPSATFTATEAVVSTTGVPGQDTPIPSETPTPSALLPQDVPEGFVPVAIDSLGLTTTPLTAREYEFIDIRAYQRGSDGISIVSMVIWLGTSNARQEFGNSVSSLIATAQYYLLDLGVENEEPEPFDLAWFEDRGNVTSAIGLNGTLQNAEYLFEVAAYKYGALGLVIMIIRPDGAGLETDLVELARILDQRATGTERILR